MTKKTTMRTIGTLKTRLLRKSKMIKRGEDGSEGKAFVNDEKDWNNEASGEYDVHGEYEEGWKADTWSL